MPERTSVDWREDRYSFLRWTVLPQKSWREYWDRIYVDPGLKERLVAYAQFVLRYRVRYSVVGLPVHGIVLLYGPPGTGKSSLARGLAQVVAETVADADGVIFAEVDPHALPSQMLGESQRNTANLLEKSIPELAAKGLPVIAVLDEIDSLLTSREITSGGRDPVDVMRATEAALRGLDYLAANHDNVLLIATSNFEAALDEAVLDRLDLSVKVGLPDADAAARILADTLSELPAVEIDSAQIADIAGQTGGLSGRAIRKLVLEALVTRSADPETPLTADDIGAVLTKGDSK